MNIVSLLNKQVQEQPDRAAIIDRKAGADRTVTFRQLDIWSKNLARQLQHAGLRSGDTVLVIHPVKAELYAILLALFRAEMVAMILDPSAGARQIQECFQICSPKAVVFSCKATMLLATIPALRSVPVKFTVGVALPGFVRLNPDKAGLASNAGDFDARPIGSTPSVFRAGQGPAPTFVSRPGATFVSAGPVVVSSSGPVAVSSSGPVAVSSSGPVVASSSGPVVASSSGPVIASSSGPVVASSSACISRMTNEIPALITFTSGSTGTPKAILRTQKFLLAQHESVNSLTGAAQADVQLVSLPVFVLSNLAAGATSVIPDCDLRHPERIPAERIAGQISRLKATQILASPAFVKSLADHLLAVGWRTPSVKKIFTGGGPIFGSTLEAIGKAFDSARVCAVYGSTEAEPISHVWLDEISSCDLQLMSKGRGLLVGAPVEHVDIVVVPEIDAASVGVSTIDQLQAFPGTAGEIIVSGPHVIESYVNEATPANKLKIDGKIWHRTGDAGFFDSSGRLWLLGRHQSRVTNTGGVKLYPFQVEGVVSAVPGVRRSAVIDCRGGAALVVEAERSSDLTGSLEKICKDFGIGTVVFLAKMPMDRRHNSKLDYPRLRAVISAGLQ